jgi:hypothetical protein
MKISFFKASKLILPKIPPIDKIEKCHLVSYYTMLQNYHQNLQTKMCKISFRKCFTNNNIKKFLSLFVFGIDI